MDLDYNALEKEVYGLLGEKSIMVLATSLDNRVTARSMSCIVLGKKIYFQTDKTFLKYDQLSMNPNVALCVDNIQIEGKAKLKGHPLSKENSWFRDIFKKHYFGSYETYSHMVDEVVVEVEPRVVTLWKYEDSKPFRDYLDSTRMIAHREFYITI